jgi:hypothetical protein
MATAYHMEALRRQRILERAAEAKERMEVLKASENLPCFFPCCVDTYTHKFSSALASESLPWSLLPLYKS